MFIAGDPTSEEAKLINDVISANADMVARSGATSPWVGYRVNWMGCLSVVALSKDRRTLTLWRSRTLRSRAIGAKALPS